MRLARRAESLASDREPTSTPSISTVPELGRSRVPMRLRSVDLPEPEGPTMATNSPSSISRLTPAQAATGGSP